ncbi:MAG: ABC transporter substrate-binding protein [Pseudomonadota bacterium]
MHLIASFVLLLMLNFNVLADRVAINAVGIPLADHYPAIIAYEKYKDEMIYADFHLKLLPGPELVRAYFRSKADIDIAFNVSPMVMDMFAKQPDFRWISLIHRDGNVFAINAPFNDIVKLPLKKIKRLPDNKIADALTLLKRKLGKPIECAIPSPLATHTTILYKYLKDHNKTMGFRRGEGVDVLLRVVKPPKSPVFLKKQAARSLPAAFEQSLPWAEVVETNGYGLVGWYSKDVMQHKHGHVECIIIAKDSVISNKRAALQEVINYIHQAGQDIELARREGGENMEQIVKMIRKHIPAHNRSAIIESLRVDLNVINYRHMNVDHNAKSSFREIMELAYEAGFIKKKINIEELADESFATEVTNK